MSGAELLERIKTEKGDYEWVVIKSGDYLIPLTRTMNSDDLVTIDNVIEFTPVGSVIFENVLKAYESGLEARPASQ